MLEFVPHLNFPRLRRAPSSRRRRDVDGLSWVFTGCAEYSAPDHFTGDETSWVRHGGGARGSRGGEGRVLRQSHVLVRGTSPRTRSRLARRATLGGRGDRPPGRLRRAGGEEDGDRLHRRGLRDDGDFHDTLAAVLLAARAPLKWFFDVLLELEWHTRGGVGDAGR